MFFPKFSFDSKEKIQLLWWFLIISIFTIFFKFNYLDMIYRGGFAIAVENYLEGDTWIEYIKVVWLMFIKNIAEVAVFLALLYFFAYKLMRINIKIVIVLSILFVLLVGVANQLSLLNVKSLLTYDSLMITVDWMKEHPDVIKSYISKKNLVYIILFVFLSFLPILFSSPRVKSTLFLLLNRVVSVIMSLLIVVSLLFYFSIDLFAKENVNLKPFDGYWTSLALSFVGDNSSNLEKREAPTLKEMRYNYSKLVYSELNKTEKQYTSFVMPLSTAKKHIVIIGLETAPQKYYPIVNNPKLKTFYQMSKSSIITDMHFTTSPYTFYSYYSVLTGTYISPEGSAIVYGKMSFNGLANVLPDYGYIPTYIDSYKTDWHEGDAFRRVIHRYGFKKVFDRRDYDYKNKTAQLSNDFDKDLYAEKVSFDKIIESIDDAVKNNKKSFVFVSTLLGHFNWKSKEVNKNLSNEKKLFEIAAVFDKLLGDLLSSLKERNLEDDVIIVVTGDHGLRYHEEYESLNELESDIAVGFNVPLMIYLPGVLHEQIKLDHASSHVDLTPTLLELVGIDISNYFFHGENILNPLLKQRMIFMMNQQLKPVNSFYSKGFFYTYNDLSNESFTSVYKKDSLISESMDMNITGNPDARLNTEEITKNAKECFNDTGAYFLKQDKY